MDTSFEEKVRERAYQIWMSAGMADGMAHEHWLTAETAVRNETAVPAKVVKSAATKAPTVKSAKPAPKATASKKAPAKKKKTADIVKH